MSVQDTLWGTLEVANPAVQERPGHAKAAPASFFMDCFVMIVTQPVTPDDWDAYYELRWKVLRCEFGQPRGSERDELESEAAHVSILSDEGILLGIGRVHWNSPEEAQIRYMAIDEQSRQRGIGRLIVQRLEMLAAAEGARQIVLNAREEVSEFYQKLGYRIVGPGPVLFGRLKHVKMTKELAANLD